jgi:hypothetical protein
MSSRRRKPAKANKRHEKWQSQAKCQRRAKKSSEEQEKLELKANSQNQHKSSKSTLPPEINSP